jgi:hypothetical protein
MSLKISNSIIQTHFSGMLSFNKMFVFRLITAFTALSQFVPVKSTARRHTIFLKESLCWRFSLEIS